MLFSSIRLLLVLAGVAFVSRFSGPIFSTFAHTAEAELLTAFFSIALIFSLSFSIFYLARGTPLPSFVIAIFFGMAAHPLLVPVIHNHAVLGAVVGFGATLILFGGGLETPFANFRKLVSVIFTLSFIGLFITAILFSLSVQSIGNLTGVAISATTAILLGALLSSTDPAAIIPILKRLRFHNPATKDIIISESAVTDVAGTLLTVAFLALVGAGALNNTILAGYAEIFSLETGALLLKQLIFGTAFGIVGYALLDALTRFKSSQDREYEVDSAFFLFIPVIIFTLALAFGGSGYLAAFVAGLLFKMNEHLEESERFFNHTIDGFFKPTIFLMLGALVDVPALIAYAPVGLLAAGLFMFVIRPLAVFVSLAPFAMIGKNAVSWKEMVFISFVRETGAIPAVLLVTIASLNLPGVEGLLPIGMWVILATLIIEPPLTPWIAEKLDVATVIPEPKHGIAEKANSAVVLATRGGSWQRRLPFVVDWAARHRIPHVTLLVCLENKNSPEAVEQIREQAHRMIDTLNDKLQRNSFEPIDFDIAVSDNTLQHKIDHLSRTQDNIVAIFVGRRMLDYRLGEVKKLPVPLYFIP